MKTSAITETESQSTADAILDAAEQLFAERGFAAVTIKEIAGKAHVNVALIYYYHDSKETLYKHVIERFVSELVRAATSKLKAAESPEDAIRGVTTAQFAMLSTRPHLPRLIVRELVDYQASHAVGVLRDLGANVFRQLVARIREGQARGVFRSDLDPRFAAFSTIAQLPYFFVARPALGALALGESNLSDDATAAAFARHAGEFAVDALRAPPPPPSSNTG
ncbi:MAG: TetR/AcrR family transcriptional regulator [Gemmatimonadaceae bacterium]